MYFFHKLVVNPTVFIIGITKNVTGGQIVMEGRVVPFPAVGINRIELEVVGGRRGLRTVVLLYSLKCRVVHLP